METLPSSTMLDTPFLDTSLLATTGISTNISIISVVSIFVASPIISTIISIPSKQEISARIVETKPQPSTKFLSKEKEKEEEIDLNEEIVIPNRDIFDLNPNQMHIIRELI